MEIRREHKNGVILEAIKTYEELTEEEKGRLVISSAEKISDYKNFRVDRNKKDEISRVKGYDLSKERSRQLNERVDFVDALQVVYGKKGSKQQRKAKERVSNSTNKAKRIAHLKDLREKQELTLVNVSDFLSEKLSKKIAYQNIQAIENGDRKIPFEWLESLSELYCCTIDELVRGDN